MILLPVDSAQPKWISALAGGGGGGGLAVVVSSNCSSRFPGNSAQTRALDRAPRGRAQTPELELQVSVGTTRLHTELQIHRIPDQKKNVRMSNRTPECLESEQMAGIWMSNRTPRRTQSLRTNVRCLPSKISECQPYAKDGNAYGMQSGTFPVNQPPPRVLSCQSNIWISCVVFLV